MIISRNTYNVELKDTFEKIFVMEPPERGSICIIQGPHRVGKSELYRKWRKEWMQKYNDLGAREKLVFCGAVTLVNVESLHDVWEMIASEVREGLEDEYKKALYSENSEFKKITECIDAIEDRTTEIGVTTLTKKIKKLLSECKKRGIHIIIIIDEMNNIMSEDKNAIGKNFFSTLRALDNSSDDVAVSFLLCSQVGMEEVIRDDDYDSILQNAKSIKLRGFNYEEINEFLDNVKRHGQEIDEQTKKRLLFYCGRFPGFLGKMCEDVRFENSVAGVDKHFYANLHSKTFFEEGEKKTKPFDGIYQWFYKKMRAIKFITEEGNEISGLDVFDQCFVGPEFYTEFELEEWLEILYNKGLIEKTIKNVDGKNVHIYDEIAESIEGSEFKEIGEASFAKKVGYEPIAPYFVEYVRQSRYKNMESEIREIRRKVRKVECHIRKLLYNYFVQADEKENHEAGIEIEKWDRICERMLKVITTKESGGKRNLDKAGYWNGKDSEGLKEKVKASKKYEYTPLDVLSFPNYHEIIVWKEKPDESAKCWEFVKGYLSYYASDNKIDDLKKDFNVLRDARNSFAHENAEAGLADATVRKQIREICERILPSQN